MPAWHDILSSSAVEKFTVKGFQTPSIAMQTLCKFFLSLIFSMASAHDMKCDVDKFLYSLMY